MKRMHAVLPALVALTFVAAHADVQQTRAPGAMTPAMNAPRIQSPQISPSDMAVVTNGWTYSADEMTLHMDGAIQANDQKDYKQAADEIHQLQNHLLSQIAALQNVDNQLNSLANALPTGKTTDQQLQQTFQQVRYAADRMHTWVPVASSEIDIFLPEIDNHMLRAEREIALGQNQQASKDLRMAVAYLAMREHHLPQNASASKRDALIKAENELSKLAAQAQNGETINQKHLRHETNKADAAWRAVTGS